MYLTTGGRDHVPCTAASLRAKRKQSSQLAAYTPYYPWRSFSVHFANLPHSRRLLEV